MSGNDGPDAHWDRASPPRRYACLMGWDHAAPVRLFGAAGVAAGVEHALCAYHRSPGLQVPGRFVRGGEPGKFPMTVELRLHRGRVRCRGPLHHLAPRTGHRAADPGGPPRRRGHHVQAAASVAWHPSNALDIRRGGGQNYARWGGAVRIGTGRDTAGGSTWGPGSRRRCSTTTLRASGNDKGARDQESARDDVVRGASHAAPPVRNHPRVPPARRARAPVRRRPDRGRRRARAVVRRA